jgi:hypothetical protein
MKAKKQKLAGRAKLATEILEAVWRGTESFREGSVGADVAYLVMAVLSDGYVDIDSQDQTYGFTQVLEILKANPKLWADVEPYLEFST